MPKVYDIIIVGAGPAGLTAAIYTVRGGRKVLVVGGIAPGGQLMLTTDVEDYPGFVQPVQGPELVRMMRDQGKRLGTEFLDEKVERVNFKKQPFELETTSKQKFFAKAVIIAVGSDYKWLNLPSEFVSSIEQVFTKLRHIPESIFSWINFSFKFIKLE